MKTYILILFVFLTLWAMSQNDIPLFEYSNIGNSNSYSEEMSNIISELDKREITTGTLADKSLILSSMDEFDGANTKVISLGKWKQIFRQLYNAQIDNNKRFLSPDSLPKAKFNSELGVDIIPIAILNIDYNQIKENALKNNILHLAMENIIIY